MRTGCPPPTLSVRAMGLYNVPVASSNSLEDLDKGLVRVPKTSLPWESGHQRNVYIAGDYLGQPKTQSRLVFYNLHELKTGDELVLKDDQGRPYKYRVSEKFATGPQDSWVMGQVRGRDMLTLQTCIHPDFGKRLVVRADRVRT
jgi:sortase A